MLTKTISEYLAAIGRKGGSVTSPEKGKAARANGRLGGRPPRKNRPRKGR